MISFLHIQINWCTKISFFLFVFGEEGVPIIRNFTVLDVEFIHTAAILDCHNFHQKLQTLAIMQTAAIGTLFDVPWSLAAQAIPENKLFLSKISIFCTVALWG